jgi:tRNA G18 (ribose-2'-O)-methylase SpoU
MNFIHQRHKPPVELERPREIVVALPPMRSNVNLSRIVRAAGVCGIRRVIACGAAKVDPKIARDGAEHVAIESPRTLSPVLKRLKSEGFRLVGLEQATNAQSLYEYQFVRRAVLVIGHERVGISQEVLDLMDNVIEIPVYGLPFSHNAATSACIAMYEYCRQFPRG